MSNQLPDIDLARTKKFMDQMCTSLTFRETPLLRLLIPTVITLALTTDKKQQEQRSQRQRQDEVFECCHQVVDRIMYELQYVTEVVCAY